LESSTRQCRSREMYVSSFTVSLYHLPTRQRFHWSSKPSLPAEHLILSSVPPIHPSPNSPGPRCRLRHFPSGPPSLHNVCVGKMVDRPLPGASLCGSMGSTPLENFGDVVTSPMHSLWLGMLDPLSYGGGVLRSKSVWNSLCAPVIVHLSARLSTRCKLQTSS
jgi:hypothetical protein